MQASKKKNRTKHSIKIHMNDTLSKQQTGILSAKEENTINWNEIRDNLEILAAERKTTLVWTREPQQPDENISQILAKLVLNVVYLAMECLPLGGVISVDNLEQKAREPIVVRLEGPKCNLRDDVQSGLIPDLPIEQLSVRNIVAYLATSFANCLEKSLKVRDENSNSIVITIS